MFSRNLSSTPSLDSILMGYAQEDPQQQFGFYTHQSGKNDKGDPLYYNGPHIMTCAPTGKGKGRSCAIPTLLEYPGQIVALDMKGELYACTARRRREMGHQVIKLDPFGNSVSGDSYNPLDMFDLPFSDLDTDSQLLASMLSDGARFSRDPFWDNSACGLLSGLICYIAWNLPKEKRNLNELRRLLCKDDSTYNIAVIMDTVGKKLRELAYQEFSSFLQLPERETRPSVLGTAQAYIKTLNSDRVARMLEDSSFSLDDFAQGKPLSIYIVIPPERVESHRCLYRIILSSLFAAIFSRRRIPDLRTLFLVDEAGNLGHLPMLKTAITLARGYGVRCWTFWQDIQQLQEAYSDCWRTLINNSGLVQVFGMTSQSMAEDWAAILGCSPSVLQSLEPHEQLLLVHDEGQRRSVRLDYLKDPRFDGGFDPNPFYNP